MPKYLLISGSPRKGNTEFVLSKIYNLMEKDKELILLRKQNIKHCGGCLSCRKKPECVIKDDMRKISKKMLNSEMLIIGTPNYYENVTGLMKDFIDRTHVFYEKELLKNKKIIYIVVGGSKNKRKIQNMKNALHGFVKHMKLNLVGYYYFEALYPTDLQRNQDANKEIYLELRNVIARK